MAGKRPSKQKEPRPPGLSLLERGLWDQGFRPGPYRTRITEDGTFEQGREWTLTHKKPKSKEKRPKGKRR